MGLTFKRLKHLLSRFNILTTGLHDSQITDSSVINEKRSYRLGHLLPPVTVMALELRLGLRVKSKGDIFPVTVFDGAGDRGALCYTFTAAAEAVEANGKAAC